MLVKLSHVLYLGLYPAWYPNIERELQIWSIGSPDPNFTLDGHSKGVNCVDYFTGGDRPYLITGSDDSTAKVCLLYLLYFEPYKVSVQS